MEWLIIALAAGGGGLATRWWGRRRTGLRERSEQVAGVRALADEDVTVLGEQLARLDSQVAGHELDEETRIYYQTALDAYESAQRSVPLIRYPDDISKVTDTLGSGRYALACVQARVAGEPLPQSRVPCFFNPQHGPSAGTVLWTSPGHGTRTVPACAQDAARVANHEVPEVRKVRIGSRQVPYWEAGAAYAPYGEGYFASAGLLIWAFQAETPIGGFDAGAGGHGLLGDGHGFLGGGHGGHDGGGHGGHDGGGHGFLDGGGGFDGGGGDGGF
ncbi:hypothetical protein [Nocardioides mesophilus]|uniref:Uncharacterized protein n=1 Tax=Nocardioides mesophilus TaxID=433659 RepID=A0A7G9REH0_9ACTN|nr:hypothetical protein [Nocardioides mesophilus]QNN53995.1 hypothetical protein H9L09_06330 [Nocardioides mesophilus]